MERHVSYQDEPLSAFQDLVALHVRAINHALSNIPRERVRLHVCWGNSEGPHIYDVPLEDILDLLYDAKVGALVMEWQTPATPTNTACTANARCPRGCCWWPGS